MIKNILKATAMMILLGSFSTVNAQKKTKPATRFLDDIEISFASVSSEIISIPKASKTVAPENAPEKTASLKEENNIEKASSLQIKYGQLLDVDVEEVEIDLLFSIIDNWYGTPYRYGGTSKSGIDCSAFVQTLYADVFGVSLPRTAREQYKGAERVSKDEIQKGDLIFFNTTGGVSHVGYYLQNNKFVHAASSGGVMISDLDDDYWARRFVGVGRISKTAAPAVLSAP